MKNDRVIKSVLAEVDGTQYGTPFRFSGDFSLKIAAVSGTGAILVLNEGDGLETTFDMRFAGTIDLKMLVSMWLESVYGAGRPGCVCESVRLAYVYADGGDSVE